MITIAFHYFQAKFLTQMTMVELAYFVSHWRTALQFRCLFFDMEFKRYPIHLIRSGVAERENVEEINRVKCFSYGRLGC